MGASGGEGLKAEGTQPGERRGKRVIKNWKILCNAKVTTFMIFTKLFIKISVERARENPFKAHFDKLCKNRGKRVMY